jgi:hypothetical protein
MNNSRCFRRPLKRLALVALIAYLTMLGCAAPRQQKILVQMIQAQEEYFSGEIIPGFNKQYKAAIQVVHYDNAAELGSELAKYPGRIALVKIPFDKTAALLSNDRLLPIDAVVGERELRDFRQTFVLTSLGARDGRQFLIPRKFETRIMVYCKSKVADALAVWRSYRDSINADLKAMNGYGLPATYILEDDPNKWDFFDVYVVGWIWAHTPYRGMLHGRIAHRGKRYSGTSQRIIDRIFQCKGDSAQVMTMKGDAVADAFMWEAAYAASSYNERMWKEAWSGADIWKGFRDNEVFLAFMTQIDCFFIHGTGQDGLDGYIQNPADMGVALMPQGCSIILDGNGAVAREGRRTVTTGGWWWGIPKDAPDPKLSYQLARYITGTKNQINDCSRFGMIPVRKDILGDMSLLFGGGWVTEVYETSFRQLMNNGSTILPVTINTDRIGNLYLDAWYDIVVNKNWSDRGAFPQWDYVRRVLESKYAPQAAKILGTDH